MKIEFKKVTDPFMKRFLKNHFYYKGSRIENKKAKRFFSFSVFGFELKFIFN